MPSFICRYCGYSRAWIIRRNKKKCKRCRRESSINVYHVSSIRSTEEEWEKCIHTFLRERTIKSVIRECGIPHSRVEAMIMHLRMCMHGDMPQVFRGITEMDETYIGGQRKNKRLHIRRIKTKRGHGTDKLPIVGVFGRNSGQVYIEVLSKKLDMNRITEILNQRTKPGSCIYTDGFKMYRSLKHQGYEHEYVDHDSGEMVRGDVHTNNIEGFWGILKRKLSCIGGMRRNKLYLFVAEIAWKFNHRELEITEQEKKLFELLRKFGG